MMHTGRYTILTVMIVTLLGISLGGCEREPATTAPQAVSQSAADDPASQAETILDQHFQSLMRGRATKLRQEAGSAADTLCGTLKVFLETPTDTNLALTRSAWITGHWKHQSTQTVHRLLGIPADATVDAWPALGGYIDRAAGYPHSGIVNDTTIEINAGSLQAQHQLTDPSEISIGFHALEYLLWGDPDDEPRTAALFQKAAAASDLGAQAAVRRRDYLLVACKLLNEKLAAQAASDPEPPLLPATQVLANAAHLLTHVLADQVVQQVAANNQTEEECGFSQQVLCGVLPAVRELLELTEDPQLAMELRSTDPSLADALRSANNAARTRLEALEEAWDTEQGRLFATSLRTLGDQLNASRKVLNQPASGV